MWEAVDPELGRPGMIVQALGSLPIIEAQRQNRSILIRTFAVIANPGIARAAVRGYDRQDARSAP